MRPQAVPSVFLVDDDPIFRNLISHSFSKDDVSIETFAEPSAFLLRARTLCPDVCLVDLHLGSPFAGFKLIELMRKELTHFPPTIVVSGKNDRESIAQSLKFGACDYLVKPVDRSVLFTKLNRHLSMRLNVPRSTPQITDLSAPIAVEGTVTGVDELGICLMTKHVILAGTGIQLSGELIRSIAGRESALAVRVLSSSFDEPAAGYRHYLEFNPEDTELRNNVKKWIEEKQKKP